MARLFALAPIAAIVLLSVSARGFAAEPASVPRALYPKFDLTYLPKVGGQGVIGFRPAEIARYATREEVKRASFVFMSLCSQVFGGTELDVDAWPTFDDLEQCVFSLQMQFVAPKDGGQGQMALGAKTPGVLRTVRPFDWDNLLKKLFPKATAARHAGRSYLKIPLRPGIALPAIFGSMAAYLADDRTLVLGSESEIHELLDRLATGTPAPKPLSGWNEVERDLIAFALDNRKEPLVSGKFPADDVGGKQMEAMADSLRTLAVGLSVGDGTRLRFVATARNDSAAHTVADALSGFFDVIGKKMAEEKEPGELETFGITLLKNATLHRDGRRVSITLAADGNVVKMILSAMLGWL